MRSSKISPDQEDLSYPSSFEQINVVALRSDRRKEFIFLIATVYTFPFGLFSLPDLAYSMWELLALNFFYYLYSMLLLLLVYLCVIVYNFYIPA